MAELEKPGPKTNSKDEKVTVIPILVASELTKEYSISRPPRKVLDNVSLTVKAGEFVAIMGASGSGKSTLLHVLGGLEPPDIGTVSVAGNDLYSLSDAELSAYRRDHIGFVFQFFNLLPNLTAAENIALPLRLRERSSWFRRQNAIKHNAVNDRISALMNQFNLHGLQGHSPEEISGGEQQRVAIARALATAPSLLLADEPTGNLDWVTGHEVMSLLAHLQRKQNQTIVLVTHDARVAAYADRVLIMQDGSMIDEVKLEADYQDAATESNTKTLITKLMALNL